MAVLQRPAPPSGPDCRHSLRGSLRAGSGIGCPGCNIAVLNRSVGPSSRAEGVRAGRDQPGGTEVLTWIAKLLAGLVALLTMTVSGQPVTVPVRHPVREAGPTTQLLVAGWHRRLHLDARPQQQGRLPAPGPAGSAGRPGSGGGRIRPRGACRRRPAPRRRRPSWSAPPSRRTSTPTVPRPASAR